MTDLNTLNESPRKRLFVALMGLTCVLIIGVAYLLYWVPTKGLTNIHPDLPNLAGVVLGILSGIALLGTLLLVLTTALGKDLFFTRFMRGVVIKFLLPVIELLGRAFGIPKDTIRQSFVAMNNSLVMSQKLRVRPDRVLILLPHCLQLFDCHNNPDGAILSS